MFCPNCGKENDVTALFCENCGTNLKEAATLANEAKSKGAKLEETQGTTDGWEMANAKKTAGGQEAGYGQNSVNNRSQGLGYGTANGQNAGYAGGAYGQMGGCGAQNQAQIEKKPFPKWALAVAAEALLAVLAIVGCIMVVTKKDDIEKVAERYFVNTANGDWEEAYEQLAIEQLGLEPDDPFINEEMFAKSKVQSSLGVVNNYQVNQESSMEESLYQWGENLGVSGDVPMVRAIRIDYRAKGDTSNKTYVVALDQASGKWKVSLSDVVFRDYRIYAPMGASVSLDGIALDESYRYLADEDGSRGDDCLDIYNIPYLFYGPHEVKVTLEDMEDVEETIQVGYDDSQYYLEAMKVKAETQDALVQKAGENMKQIYEAAITGKDFSAVESLFTANQETRQEIKGAYEYLMTEASQGDTRLLKVNIYNMAGTMYDAQNAVNVSYEYGVDYIYEDVWSGETETDTYSGNGECQFYFVKEDGNWVQTNLGCDLLYY